MFSNGEKVSMKIENLSVAYKDKVIFSHFNLEIAEGEITCILGNSGVGKTTLIRHIAQKAQQENKKVAVAFQEPRLFRHLTVLENLKLIGYDEKEIYRVLEKIGLDKKVHSYPNQLSGGEKQRVNFARAFLSDSDILLLDEPFFSLDVKLKIRLIKLLIEEKQQKTIVFVTHDIDEALMLSNRIILLKNGEIALDFTVDKDIRNREYGKLHEEREVLLNAQLL